VEASACRAVLGRAVWALLACATLLGCDQQALIDNLASKEEVDLAKQVITRITAGDDEWVQKRLDASLRGPGAREGLEQIRATMPREEPRSVTLIGFFSHHMVTDGATTYDLTFEYEYPQAWVVAYVRLLKRDGVHVIQAARVNPSSASLKETHAFTFQGKGAKHGLFLAAMIAIPLFIVYALVLCRRTPIARRKWLWYVFIALGFVQVALNWTTGELTFQPVSFLLLGAGFFSPGPHGPTLLSIAFPLGAIVFMIRRPAMLRRAAPDPPPEVAT
jgi:hypothetical protein